MHKVTSQSGRPGSWTFRGAMLGGASLIAIAAMGFGPAMSDDGALPPVQVAQRPSQTQPPLTDSNTPWDQSRAEAARDATKAMTDAIEGFKALAQHAILINNPGLLNMARGLIKYYGDLCKALRDRAYDILTGGTTLTPATTKAVRATAGNGQLGQEAAEHALDEINKAQQGSNQQSRAPTLPSTTQQTAAAPREFYNTVVPANPLGSLSICGPGQKCTASLDDRLFAYEMKRIGDESIYVSDLCRMSNLCTPIAGQPGMVQFSPVKRPEGDPSAPREPTPGSKVITFTSGSYVNPNLTATPPAATPVSPFAWNVMNGAYNNYRTSLSQPTANAYRNDMSRSLTNLFRSDPFIDHGLLTDMAAPNVIMRSYHDVLVDLAAKNPPNGRGGLWDYGLSGERRIATKQILNEDFNRHAASETVPAWRSPYEVDFNSAQIQHALKFWSGNVLAPTDKANDTLQLHYDIDWKGTNPYLNPTYTYRPTKSDISNNYIRYSFEGGGTSLYFAPGSATVTEANQFKSKLEVPSSYLTDSLKFDFADTYRRNLTDDLHISAVESKIGAYAGYTYNAIDRTRWTQFADPGKSCDSLAYPTDKINNIPLDGMRNFIWQRIVPETPASGAACELNMIRPTGFFSSEQQLIARRMSPIDRAVDSFLSAMYSYFYGCDYYYYYYAPKLRVGLWEPLRLLYTQSPQPNDPLLSSKGTWRQSYDDQWWMKAINWIKPDGTTVLPDKGKPVTVAVIDTGLDIRHPELFGALWVNPAEPAKPPRPGMFRNPMQAHWLGWNFMEDNGDIRDYNGHGTIVAGIIAADVNNKMGIAGINPWAKIMPLKVADHRGRSSTIAAAKAIVYAADNGARVINMSLGHKEISEVVKRAIDYAARKNVLIVVSAGNEGVDTSGFTPSAFANTIAVAAVDTGLKRAGFSNFGDNITISAPGVDILSLRAGGTDLMRFVRTDYKPASAVVNDRYYRVDGTSFAAPMVAGVASLILSTRPELTAADVKRMILQSARDISGIGRDRNLGYGLLDADAAVKADPAFFVDGVISGLSVVQANGRQAVEVKGTATANRMRAAWIEIGQGENPTEWKKVTDNITRPVENGVVGDVEARNFAGAKVWTVRVVVEHENGRKREARYVLRLG